VQLYRYFVSQYSEFCRHNPLCCFSTSVYCKRIFRYRLSPETSGYALVYSRRDRLGIGTDMGSVSVVNSNPKCVTRRYVCRMTVISFMLTSLANVLSVLYIWSAWGISSRMSLCAHLFSTAQVKQRQMGEWQWMNWQKCVKITTVVSIKICLLIVYMFI
jgi:hypothetical protein